MPDSVSRCRVHRIRLGTLRRGEATCGPRHRHDKPRSSGQAPWHLLPDMSPHSSANHRRMVPRSHLDPPREPASWRMGLPWRTQFRPRWHALSLTRSHPTVHSCYMLPNLVLAIFKPKKIGAVINYGDACRRNLRLSGSSCRSRWMPSSGEPCRTFHMQGLKAALRS